MSNSMNKRLLIICRKPPYGNSIAREAIDIALAASAFDQTVALLFIHDGVWQLNKGQDSEDIKQKNHGKALSALPLYGIEDIYVHSEALSQRQLTAADLLLPVKTITQHQLADLIDSYDTVFNF